MREGDADLGETLPQVTFFARTSLPTSLKDLMRSKRPALSYQTPGQFQRLRRRQWLLRNRLDTGRPVRQRPTKSVTRSFLTRTTGSVAVPVGGHGWIQPECPRTIPNVIRPMLEVCPRTSATAAYRPPWCRHHSAHKDAAGRPGLDSWGISVLQFGVLTVLHVARRERTTRPVRRRDSNSFPIHSSTPRSIPTWPPSAARIGVCEAL